ncbi:hypothetical protein C0995_015022 [Termitomyces sp. Mi166|nr:hypothetical protein C0995_015022 [Termitomyces sp. Mi166\
MNFIQRDLFGGAISAQTPSNLRDAADIRQVPDNQEVFLYADSGVSIIVEILEKVEPTDFNDAARHVFLDLFIRDRRAYATPTSRFHFDSLAHDNSAVSAVVDGVNVIPNDRGDDTPSTIVLFGTQQVPKFNHTEPDTIHVFMALYRVTSKPIDLVVSFNVPTKTSDGNEVSREYENLVREHFNKFIRSFKIVDYGLFA